MNNMEMRVEGNKLVIEVDLTKEMGISGSGKSMGVASSNGNVRIPGKPEFCVGLNVFKPLPKDQRRR